MEIQACTRNILEVIDLCRKLLFLADKGDMQRNDESCGVLFGVTRDDAYHIIDLAEKERKRHIRNGTWDESIEGLVEETTIATKKE